MNKWIILLLLFSSGRVFAQNDIQTAEYYFDNEPGLGAGVAVTGFTGGQDVTINFVANISSLTPGFHNLYVRAKNDTGWSLPISKPFLKESVSYLDPKPDIVAAEYYFDNDPGLAQGSFVNIGDGPDTSVSFSADLSGVSAGFHVLYVRAVDSKGIWSHIQSRPFLKESVTFQDPLINMASLEYYIDTDPGFGQGTLVALSSAIDVQQSFVADLSGVSPGLHILYVRAKDVTGVWSLIVSHPFLKENAAPLDPLANITSTEYYFDNDPGLGAGTPVAVTPATDVTRTFTASLAGLSPGFHIMYVRSLDASGVWSLAYSRPFLMESDPAGNIVSIDYYYRKRGVNSGVSSKAVSPAPDLSLNFLATPNTLQADSTYEMHVHAVDAAGQVSLETIHSFTARSGGLPNKLPYRSRTIPDLSLNEDFDSTSIAFLDTVFLDSNLLFGIDSLRLSYTAGTAIVTAAFPQRTMKLYSIPDLNGPAQIVVTATDDSGAVARDTFVVTVNAINDPPVRVSALRDTAIHENFTKTFLRNLPAVFQDVDNGALTYTVVSLAAGATAILSNDSLYVASVFGFVGNASFRVTATDNSFTIADTFLVTVTSAPQLGLSTSIHQNPALSRYADVYVIADTTLATIPAVKLFIGTDSSSAIAMNHLSGRIYKGAVQFGQSGSYQIRSQAFAITGSYVSATRSFAVSLAKPGLTTDLITPDGYAKIRIGRTATKSETYFIAQEDRIEGENRYTFGPAGEYAQPIEITLYYDDGAYTDPGKLFVANLRDGKWVSLDSRVDPVMREIHARTGVLGQFKILFDPAFAGTNLLPTEFALSQNFPNPFNPATSLSYDLPRDGDVTITIYNILGQRVRTLVHGFREAGRYTVTWNGRNDNGIQVASGAYLYRLQADDFVRTRKMMLIK